MTQPLSFEAAVTAANDNPHVRLTIRQDRATVVVVGDPQNEPHMSRLFRASDSAAVIDYGQQIAEVLGTRVRYVVIDHGAERIGWLPVIYHQEKAS